MGGADFDSLAKRVEKLEKRVGSRWKMMMMMMMMRIRWRWMSWRGGWGQGGEGDGGNIVKDDQGSRK